MFKLDNATSKGFLNCYDLRGSPIIANFLTTVLQNDVTDKNYDEKIEEFVSGELAMESYKWLYNFIVLCLYLICVESLQAFDDENYFLVDNLDFTKKRNVNC